MIYIISIKSRSFVFNGWHINQSVVYYIFMFYHIEKLHSRTRSSNTEYMINQNTVAGFLQTLDTLVCLNIHFVLIEHVLTLLQNNRLNLF